MSSADSVTFAFAMAVQISLGVQPDLMVSYVALVPTNHDTTEGERLRNTLQKPITISVLGVKSRFTFKITCLWRSDAEIP